MHGVGICHVCPEPRPVTKVEYCSLCGHYFCEDCKEFRSFRSIWKRGLDAVKEAVGKKRPGCCWMLEAS